MEFVPLASSSGGNCYRVDCPGSASLLIDCGIRFPLIQQALDFRVTSLAGCLISHAHGDHIKAAKDLMRAGVDCYASPETWVARPDLVVAHRAKSVRAQETFGISSGMPPPGANGAAFDMCDPCPWRVKPFEVVHDQAGTLGFLIDAPDGSRLCYLTDSCYSLYRFQGLTHLAIECNYSSDLIREGTAAGVIGRERFRRTVQTHMSLERLLDLLAANDLSKCEEIWLLHLSRENSSEEEFKERVQRAVGIPTYIAGEVCV